MNQDSDPNEPRREGERRSFGRRDDDRDKNSERPRSDRDRNAGAARTPERASRPTDNRPRFDRDRPDDRPRFGQNRDDDRPRFSRDNGPRDRNDDRPRFDNRGDRPRANDRSRSDRRDDGFRDRRDRPSDDFRRNSPRADDRPRFDRDDRPRRDTGSPDRGPRNSDQRRPRFEDNRTDDRSRRPNESGERRFNDRNRNDDRPRFNQDRDGGDASFRNRDDRPRFDRSTGPQDRGDDRPRFDRDRYAGGAQRPAFNRDRDNDQPTDRPRFSRDNGPRDRNDADRPRSFDRDSRRNRNAGDAGTPERASRPTDNRFTKPGFKRVGGFSREADERNRFERDENARFSPEQRKDSADRRTGRYDQAPDYNLDRNRGFGSRDRSGRRERDERSGGPRNRDEKPRRTATDDEPGMTRLNRYIANSGVCSRREADDLIARGDISVNGNVVTEMGYKVKEGDTVKYGTKVLNPERFAYVLLNKPKDYITTTEDPEERKTVMELVADAGNFRLYPVGRLDRNTTGLLLLTNDGELADKLTHPSNNIRKIYQVEIDKPITTEHFEAIQQGIELEDGSIKPDALSIVTPDAQVVGIEIHSGRNRIVRRIFEHFGYEVTKLDRTTFAGLTKKDLPRGKWRFLEPKEVVKLKYFN